MFMLRNLAGGVFCTDYTSQTFVVLQNVTLGRSFNASASMTHGTPVYLGASGSLHLAGHEPLALLYDHTVDHSAATNNRGNATAMHLQFSENWQSISTTRG